MTSTKKTARYTMRLNPAMKRRLREMADELNTSMPDLMTIGAMSLFFAAKSPIGFLTKKSDVFVQESSDLKGTSLP